MKFAMALGGAVPGFVLSYTGYVANKEQLNSASVGIIVSTFAIPFVLYILTILVFNYGFVFSKKKSLLKRKKQLSDGIIRLKRHEHKTTNIRLIWLERMLVVISKFFCTFEESSLIIGIPKNI